MKRAVLLLCGMMLLGGCASILNESKQTVNVTTSNGKQITGTVDGQQFTAPGVVRLERAKEAKIFMTDAEGCTKQTVAENAVDTKFFINIFSGGAFGSSTDFSTGKMWKYNENVIINCTR